MDKETKFKLGIILLLTIWCSMTEGRRLNIIGGTPANKGEFPWMASLQVKLNPLPATHICGASILNSTFLVTAGHCAYGYRASDLQVLVGTLNIIQIEGTQQIRNVINILVHPEYQNTDARVRNDIALLEIYPPFVMNEYVNAISLPETTQTVIGYCWIAGWGQTESATSSDILLKANLPIVTKPECEVVYSERLDKDTQLCAGYARGGTDVCIGDTGGPLICDDMGKSYLAGIASWGYKCGSPNYPGVYTEISYYTRRRDEEPYYFISM